MLACAAGIFAAHVDAQKRAIDVSPTAMAPLINIIN
jgi:hypothetical protein